MADETKDHSNTDAEDAQPGNDEQQPAAADDKTSIAAGDNNKALQSLKTLASTIFANATDDQKALLEHVATALYRGDEYHRAALTAEIASEVGVSLTPAVFADRKIPSSDLAAYLNVSRALKDVKSSQKAPTPANGKTESTAAASSAKKAKMGPEPTRSAAAASKKDGAADPAGAQSGRLNPLDTNEMFMTFMQNAAQKARDAAGRFV